MTPDDAPERPSAWSLIADPLRTMAVMLVIIGVLAGAQHLLSSEGDGDPVRAVEYATAAESARDVAPFTVLAPAELPAGWRATSVRYVPGDDASWHLGILTDDDRYVGLEQSGGDVDELVEEHVAAGEPAGEVTIEGDIWQLLRGDGETTLFRDGSDAATVVTGDAPQEDVELLVATLER